MEVIIDGILELIAELIFILARRKDVPKWIRNPAIALVTIFAIIIISLLVLVGVAVMRKNFFLGFLIIIAIGLGVLYLMNKLFKKVNEE